MTATLLLIEDEPEIRTMLKLSLEDEGYTVLEAADGTTGLAVQQTQQPDLVLLDLRLPDRRGLDVCRDIRSGSIVPIIIVTAQTDTHDLVAGLEAGADDFVTKPVVPKALAARIRALLRRVGMKGQADLARIQLGDLEVRAGALQSGAGLLECGSRAGDGGDVAPDGGFSRDGIDLEEELACLDAIAFCDRQLGDASHGLGADVDGFLGIDLAGGRDDRF